MKKRYKNTTIGKFKAGMGSKRSGQTGDNYLTTFYSNVPESNSDIYVITQQGDRLDNLAYQYYGSSTYWWFIANVNNLNKMNLEPGTRLRIPTSIAQANTF